MKMLEGKKTKIGAIGFGVSGTLFLSSLYGIPIALAYGMTCYSMMFFSWGIYDRIVKAHHHSQELRDKQIEIFDKGLFQEREIDGVKTKAPRIKSRGII